MFTDKILGEDAVNITKNVFDKYEYYLGMNLAGDNLGHFQNATDYQFQAINDFIGSDDVSGFINYQNKANDEYEEIVI